MSPGRLQPPLRSLEAVEGGGLAAQKAPVCLFLCVCATQRTRGLKVAQHLLTLTRITAANDSQTNRDAPSRSPVGSQDTVAAAAPPVPEVPERSPGQLDLSRLLNANRQCLHQGTNLQPGPSGRLSLAKCTGVVQNSARAARGRVSKEKVEC